MLFVIFFFRFHKKTMNADKDRLKLLLTETITLLCQRGLTFKRELHVQGLLGITVDDDVFLVPVDDRKSYTAKHKQPWFVNCEAVATNQCELIPGQSETLSVHQTATSEVPDVNRDFLSAAGGPCPPSQYPAAENESGSSTAVKTEILGVENIHSSSENKIHLSDNGLNENWTATEQLHTASGDVTHKRKRKRKRCKFGNNILTLPPANDEWTDVSQRGINAPVVGYSQWADYNEGVQHDISVSIF